MENVAIQRQDGKNASQEKVLYVSGMKCNLMTVDQFLGKGYPVIIEDE
jgi:hypothetical protein